MRLASQEDLDDWLANIRMQIAKQVVEKVDPSSAKEGLQLVFYACSTNTALKGFVRTIGGGSGLPKIGYLMLSGQRLLFYKMKPATMHNKGKAVLEIDLAGAVVRFAR